MKQERTAGLGTWRITEFCRRRVLCRRSTGGPTARETSPPPAPCEIKVYYRDIALDARVVGNSLGSCLLIEFDGAAIATSKPCGGYCGSAKACGPGSFLTQVTRRGWHS